MLKQDIYAIYTKNSEFGGSIKELFTSFKEAMQARFKYANWFCDKGDIWIYLYKGNSPFNCSHRWRINPNGAIQEEYNF